jgi:hypothetical protein
LSSEKKVTKTKKASGNTIKERKSIATSIFMGSSDSSEGLFVFLRATHVKGDRLVAFYLSFSSLHGFIFLSARGTRNW